MLEVILFSTLNGLLYGLLLFMLSAGLSLIFSMMGVLNFAHASFYMLGAYVAFAIGVHAGFWTGLFLAPVVVGLIGCLVERFGLRHSHELGHVSELLFTFGLALLIEEVVKLIWGTQPVPYGDLVPAGLKAPLFTLFGIAYPGFKILVIGAALLLLVVLWGLLKKTRAGLMVQAALTHPEMVGHLGHNVPALFMGVFGLGCAMAAFAGAFGGALLVTEPGMATALGPIVFVVVVVGGMGSLPGAFLASLLIGLLQTFAIAVEVSVSDVLAVLGIDLSGSSDVGRITLAQIAPILPFLLLVGIMIVHPKGLMGVRES